MIYWIHSLWEDGFQSEMYPELVGYGDRWNLNFNYNSLSDVISNKEQRRGWMVHESWTYGSFCCSHCSREWDSVNAKLLFRYRRQSASRRGTVIMMPYVQQSRCCGTSVFPGFLERDVDNALEDLSAEIRNNCYSEEDDEDGPFQKTYDSVMAFGGYARAENKVRYVVSNLGGVTNALKDRIERETVGQRTNPLWSAYRKNRITSSNFGEVLAAVRRRSYPASLFRMLLGKDDLSRVEAVRWGIDNESVAKEEYTRRTGMYIQERGVFLSDSGLLGASPDGTVYGGDRNIEVKCPWSARNMTVRQAVAQIGGFCLECDEYTQVLTLKQNHNYWHQIQGALHLSGANRCDLVIWTPFDMKILTVAKDPTWAGVNIGILETFYEDVFLPHILYE